MDVPRFFSSAEDILKIAEHCAVDAMLVQVYGPYIFPR